MGIQCERLDPSSLKGERVSLMCAKTVIRNIMP